MATLPRPFADDLRDRRGSTTGVLLVLLVIAAIGVFFAGKHLGWEMPGTKKAAGPRIISHTVKRGIFVLDSIERGEVESFDNAEVRCEAKSAKGSELKILEVVPEGTSVDEGDFLIQLDARALEQDMVEQQISCNSQEASMINSKNTYEAAKISLREYEEGTYEQLEQEAQSAIFIAEETLQRSKEYLAYSERLSARGYVTPQQLDGDRFALKKAGTELDAAETRLRVLQEFTKPKQMLSLESDVRSAKADWDSDQSSYKLELAKLEDLKNEIDKCRITAPQAGQVIYVNRTSSRGNSEFLVEAGASVREGQVIIQIPRSGLMQVEAKVNESRITNLKEGLPASVRIEAVGDRELAGEVTHVNEYPVATSWYSSQTKEYETKIRILEDLPGLRPGLTAEVTIHIDRREDAILIPVQSVYERGRRTWCFREKENASEEDGIDAWEAVEIFIDANNDKYITIEDKDEGDDASGIQAGDKLAMNPKSLVEFMNLPDPEGAVSSREALGGSRPGANKDRGGRPGAGSGRPGGGRPNAAAGGGRPGGGGRPNAAAGAGRPRNDGKTPGPKQAGR